MLQLNDDNDNTFFRARLPAEGSPSTVFGRLYYPDPNDASYPLSAPLLRAALKAERHWTAGPITDQGREPQCVGHGCLQLLTSSPTRHRRKPLPSAAQIYHGAQEIDEWPGPPPPYGGTSVRAGMKVLKNMGLISEYRWARDIETARNFVLTRGPLVVGTDWFTHMSEPHWINNPKKRQHDAYAVPEGSYQGGHCYVIIGYSKKRDAFRIINSWGEGWAEQGRAWITFDYMNYLLFQASGEAVSALEV